MLPLIMGITAVVLILLVVGAILWDDVSSRYKED